MCCSSRNGPKWKREVVQEHKFEYVDIDEFYDPSCLTRLNYSFVYLAILKSFLVYIADLWTAVSLLAIDQQDSADSAIPYSISKWIFLGAIMISFLLMFWDIRKSRSIIASRDIAFAFTSTMASRYYSMKDYRYYCLFCEISKSQKTIDSITFFVFFTLKGWKRLLLAEAPRQVINVVTLITLIPTWIKLNKNQLNLNNQALGKSLIQKIMTCTMLFSVIVFAISLILVFVAVIAYIPLMCHMRGNLKEYCCHKVDKRISELLKKQARRRLAANQKTGGKSKNKNKMIEMNSLPQPTLPNVNMGDMGSNRSPYQTQPQMLHHPGADRVHNHFVPPFARRNSESSMQSDQLELTLHAQPQPWSGTSSNFANPYYNSNSSFHGSEYSHYNPNSQTTYVPSPSPNPSPRPQYHQPHYTPQDPYF
ncbi:hypothetical protein BDF14DRAFT_1752371 [Spinellus fusiger]|nr:hypothetical protein BDF14DRAFT_1752371 [Spinellus fusiger]